jgi:hypothetical protein
MGDDDVVVVAFDVLLQSAGRTERRQLRSRSDTSMECLSDTWTKTYLRLEDRVSPVARGG